jgi:hypothetical protein
MSPDILPLPSGSKGVPFLEHPMLYQNFAASERQRKRKKECVIWMLFVIFDADRNADKKEIIPK